MRAFDKVLCNSPLTRTCGTWNAIGLIEQWAWLPGDRSVHYPALCPSLLDRAAAGQQLLTSKQDVTANLLNAHANLAGSTTLCLEKNDNDVLRYNYNGHQPILIIFGRDIAD